MQAKLRTVYTNIRADKRASEAYLASIAYLSRANPRRIAAARACIEASARWLDAADHALEPDITFDQFEERAKAVTDATSALEQARGVIETL